MGKYKIGPRSLLSYTLADTVSVHLTSCLSLVLHQRFGLVHLQVFLLVFRRRRSGDGELGQAEVLLVQGDVVHAPGLAAQLGDAAVTSEELFRVKPGAAVRDEDGGVHPGSRLLRRLCVDLGIRKEVS